MACLVSLPFVLNALHIYDINLLQTLDNTVYDAKINYLGSMEVDRRIVIVDVDDASLLREGQWPWSRRKIATLVDNLFDNYGVRAVGFDIVFAEPDRVTEGVRTVVDDLLASDNLSPEARSQVLVTREQHETDAQLAKALANRSTVLGYIFTEFTSHNADMKTGVLPSPVKIQKTRPLNALPYISLGYLANLPILQSAAKAGGYFDNPLVDPDGVYRRVPLLQFHDGALYESLSLALLREAQGLPPPVLGTYDAPPNADVDYIQVGGVQVPVDDNLAAMVPFRGRQGSFPYVSASQVLHQEAPIETLFDAIVLIGTTAAGLYDLRSTPVGRTYAGVEIHANLISGMLDGRIWHKPDWAPTYDVVAIAVTALVLSVTLPFMSPLFGALLFAFVVSAGVLLNFLLAFGGYIFLPLAGFVTSAFVVSMVLIGINAISERRKKRYLSRTFAKYVPRELVAQFEATEAEVSLEGESREMTILFSDIRNFTSISEHLPPTELTQLMNHYLTPVTQAIQRYRGNVDKYIGDAVMAFWGAPLQNEQHAQDAVGAALAMQAALVMLRAEFRERGWPELKMGIGINTAVVNIGNMGSEFRTAYTVLGDGVNLASRLEGLSKYYDAPIVVSEHTVAKITGYTLRELDRVRVKGKSEPITIYEVMAVEGWLSTERTQQLADYEEALSLYRERDWPAAESAFSGLCETYPDAGLYRLYQTRCKEHLVQPPATDWDGVYSMSSK
jgi:adenylate cyclase